MSDADRTDSDVGAGERDRPANGKVTIFLTVNSPTGTKIAWFVFG